MGAEGTTTRTSPIRDKSKIQLLLNTPGRDGLYFNIALYTALRIGEIRKLKWSGLVNAKTGEPLAWQDIFIPKQKRWRKIDFHPDLQVAIKRFYYPSKHALDNYVFKSSHKEGYPLTDVAINKYIVKRWFDEYGITESYPSSHCLRKTMARNYFEKHGLTKTQQMLGHASQATTLRYIGITDEEISAGYRDLDYNTVTLVDKLSAGDIEWKGIWNYFKASFPEGEWNGMMKDYLRQHSKDPDEINRAMEWILESELIYD